MTLQERLGRVRHSYIKGAGCLDGLYRFIERAEQNRKAFLFPQDLEAAPIHLQRWSNAAELSQIVFGNLESLSTNQQDNTLKLQIWDKRPF